MIPALLLQLALCTFSAYAFYPYTPAWLKEKEELTVLGEAKRNAASNSVKGGVAFAIEQRTSEVSDSRMKRPPRSLFLFLGFSLFRNKYYTLSCHDYTLFANCWS